MLFYLFVSSPEDELPGLAEDVWDAGRNGRTSFH